jgi:hypothetical protein
LHEVDVRGRNLVLGKEPTTEDGSCAASTISVPVILPSMPEDKQGVQSTVAVVLPSAQVCSSSVGTDMTKPILINSSVSLSQLWYTRRVKEKVAKQLNFFFDKSEECIKKKKRKGAQPLVHRGYTKGLRGEKREEI